MCKHHKVLIDFYTNSEDSENLFKYLKNGVLKPKVNYIVLIVVKKYLMLIMKQLKVLRKWCSYCIN